MTDPADDFGAGLLPQQQQVVAPVAVPADPVQDSFYQQFASRFTIPEGVTPEGFDDYLVQMSEKAAAAEELERKYAELEAQAAASARASEPVPVATQAQEAAKRRWESQKIDQQYKSFVKPDPSGYGYIPLQAGNITHIRAADAMNQKAMRDQEFSQAFLEDPYATAEELVDARFRALEEKFQKQLEEAQKQLMPIQEQIAMTAIQRKEQEFVEANAAKLFNADGEFTQLGSAVDTLMKRRKIGAEEAMADAEAILGLTAQQAAPAAPVKTAPLSKVAQQQAHAKPARFVDNLSQQSRMPVDRPEYEGGNGKKRKTVADLNREFGVTPLSN